GPRAFGSVEPVLRVGVDDHDAPSSRAGRPLRARSYVGAPTLSAPLRVSWSRSGAPPLVEEPRSGVSKPASPAPLDSDPHPLDDLSIPRHDPRLAHACGRIRDRADGDLDRILEWPTVDAGADEGKRDAASLQLVGDLERAPVARDEQRAVAL